MEVHFGPTENHFEDYFNFIRSLTISLWTAIFMVMFLVRLIQELLSKYIDVVTLIQYAIILIFVGSNLVLHTAILFELDVLIDAYFSVVQILLLMYHWLNLYCWSMMIFHIDQTNRFNHSGDYKSIHKKTIKTEIVSFSMILIIHLLPIWVYIFSPLAISNEIFTIFHLIYLVLLLLVLVLMYFRLTRTLEKNLNHYYLLNKTNLLVLLLFNALNYLWYIIFWIIVLTGKYDSYAHGMNDFHTCLKLVYIAYVFLFNFSIYFLAYFNIRNINFKKYLQVTYDGLGIGHYFEGASIFIYKSPFYRQREYLKVKDKEILGRSPNLNRRDLYESIKSESDSLSDSQKERNYSSYAENYLKLHNKK